MKKITCFLVIIINLIILTQVSKSQVVLVSEYNNLSTGPPGEWTELIVTQDNVSLVGYTLRDNSGSTGVPVGWTGGVMFKDHQLWRGLRRGTIIVINHRGSTSPDYLKYDGYIEIDAENSTYFEKVCFGCTMGTWSVEALNIAQESDIVEIISPTLSHIHSLSHINSQGGAGNYLTISGCKINHENTLEDGGSIRVVPGTSLADYCTGSGTVQTAASRDNITKGKPNLSRNSTDENQLLWRTLRQPDWVEPNLNAMIKPDHVELAWWNALSDFNPFDSVLGYLIVKFYDYEVDNAGTPQDGKVYTKGQKIGSAVVLADIPSSQTIQYRDTFDFKCGTNIYYRIYAYRYKRDDLGDDYLPTYARGRQYNEGFAEDIARKYFPNQPTLTTPNNIVNYCEGDSVVVTCNDDGGVYYYEWFDDGVQISGESTKTITIKKNAKLRANIINKATECSSTSTELKITFYSYPKTTINLNNEIVKKDTTLIICAGEAATLTSFSGETRKWLVDGNVFNTGETKIIPTKTGTYCVVGINGNLCPDTSMKVRLIFKDINYVLVPTALNYYVDKTQTFQDKNIQITNLSNDTLFFDDIVLAAHFAFIPAPPEFILPKQSVNLTIRFTPTKSGNYSEKIIFVLPCNGTDTLDLFGYKESSTLDPNMSEINFGDIIGCGQTSRDTLLTLHNIGTDTIYVREIIVDAPFSVTGVSYPYTLPLNKYLDVTVEFLSDIEGNYESILKIPYQIDDNIDTLKIKVMANVILPKFKIEPATVTLAELTACDSIAVDSVKITNYGKVKLTFNSQTDLDEFTFLNLPIELDSGKSQYLKFKFAPEVSVDSIFTLTVTAEPCNLTHTFFVHGKKSGISIGFKNDTLDFGDLINCSGKTISAVDTIVLYAQGESATKPKIKDYTISSNFTTDIVKGKELLDSNMFKITFSANANGLYTGTLKVKIDLCDIERTIYLKANFVNTTFTFTTSKLDFGKTYQRTAVERSFTFTNNSGADVVLETISSIVEPFTLISPDVSEFPLIIKKDSSKVFNIKYLRDTASVDTINIIFIFNSPCDVEKSIQLTAETMDIERIGIIAIIPTNLKQKYGDNVLIPVSLKSKVSNEIEKTGIEKMNFDINFNGTMLYPISMSKGEIIESKPVVNFTYNEIVPGKVRVNIEFSSPTTLTDGELVKLKSKVLIGNSKETSLTTDSINIVSLNPISIENQNGLFTVDPLELLLDINGSDDFYLGCSNPIVYKGILVVNNLIDVPSEISIYNLLGQKVKELYNGVMPLGKNEIVFYTSELARAPYFIVRKVQSETQVIRVIIGN